MMHFRGGDEIGVCDHDVKRRGEFEREIPKSVDRVAESFQQSELVDRIIGFDDRKGEIGECFPVRRLGKVELEKGYVGTVGEIDGGGEGSIPFSEGSFESCESGEGELGDEGD